MRISLSALTIAFLTSCSPSAPAPDGAHPTAPRTGGSNGSVPASAQQAGASAGWWAEVSQRLAADAAAFRPVASGAYEANPRGMSATLLDDGLWAQAGGARSGGLGLRLSGLGREEHLAAVPDAAPAPGQCTDQVSASGACIRRIEQDHGEVTTWWATTAEGVEQGFQLAEAPEGPGELQLRVAVIGADLTLQAGAARMVDGAGTAWRYGGLAAWDARGQTLDSWMTVDGDAVLLHVDDQDARYPITVDPVLSTATSALSAPTTDDSLGAALSSAGDVNADGYLDLLIGAPDETTGYGKAYLFLGSSTGFLPTASTTLTGTESGESFGSAAVGAGDVNNDGYDDVVVGAPNYSSDKGRFLVYHGSSTGLSSTAKRTVTGSAVSQSFAAALAGNCDYNGDGYADIVVGAPDASSGAGRFAAYKGTASGIGISADFSATFSSGYHGGRSVGCAGDMNADGYAEVIVGAYGYSSSAGRVYIYYGASSGLAGGASRATLSSTTTGEQFGWSVNGAGDVNGDGYDDALIGANAASSSAGKVYVFHGISTVLTATAPSGASATLTGSTAGDELGYAVAPAGDVDGDGYADVVIGAPAASSGAGQASVFHGSAAGLSTTATRTWTGGTDHAALGYAIAPGADLDGDGYDDVLVSAYNASYTDESAALIYAGSSSGAKSAPMFALYATEPLYAWSVAGAGDVNRDGYADVIVGQPSYGSDTGRAFVFHGASTGVSTAYTTTLTGTDGAGLFGWSVAGAGDVNGDGYADVIVGAYGTSSDMGAAYVFHGASSGLSSTVTTTISGSSAGDELGSTVSSAGDVNGDGYDDVVVGAPGGGFAEVHHGSSSGVSSTAASSLSSSDDGFGVVASAGDVDGDGYDDVIVGSPGASGGDGEALVYLGSTSGVSTSAVATLSGASGSAFGGAVAGAGDVNGDGYDDVAVGAASYSSGRGRVYVFHGRSSGMNSTAATTLTGDSSGDSFGSSVASAGNLDNDDYDDLIVGAPGVSSSTGAAYTFQGSPSGVSSTASTTLSGSAAGDELGFAIAGAGDVDSDNYDDVIVGATGYDSGLGQAAVYHGYAEDNDGDGYAADSDCDDTDTAINPGATEICDAADTDEDCDDRSDDDDASVASSGESDWYADADDDGYGDASSSLSRCDAPTGYVADSTDCDDDNASANPGETEVCDAADTDEDCDGDADDDDSSVSASSESTWYRDVDGDDYGRSTTTTSACDLPTGYADNSTDCDDTDDAINPGATEVCDSANTDEDCDGDADDDDASATGTSTEYADADSDGYGDAAAGTTGCDLPSGGVSNSTDCDDTDSGVHPGATEICDASNTDEDCDGDADDQDSSVASSGETTWYRDADSDGYGLSSSTKSACDLPSGYADNSTDCDDGDADIHPGATEVCDAADTDEDCDGDADDDDSSAASSGKTTWYRDADSDGYGLSSSTRSACDLPSGYVANKTDCDDGDDAVNPGAAEICDASDTDEDCDGDADDDDSSVSSSGMSTGYADLDDDGYGDPASAETACDLDSALLADNTDCDDGDGAVNPGETEICDAADTDEDCDGKADDDDPLVPAAGKTTWYLDSDDDGFGDAANTKSTCDLPSGYVADNTDCDDDNAAIHPDATEICDAADTDEDCDGDADDDDASVSSAGQETGYRDEDEDGFGLTSETTSACTLPSGYVSTGGDCDDGDDTINPDATEICDDDDTDEDCDGDADDDDASVSASGKISAYADEDGDSFGSASDSSSVCDLPAGTVADSTDCDDDDAEINPDATEICDDADTDEDCDGDVDDDDASVSSVGMVTTYVDGDGDGYGSDADTRTACDATAGYADNADDCDDDDAGINPGAAEICDALDTDEDCDGDADDADSSASSSGMDTWYEDTDGDGYGSASDAVSACDLPSGYASDAGDCDEGDVSINPDAAEICDAANTDEDCDGLADDLDSSVSSSGMDTWYEDADADGYGTATSTKSACDLPSGHADSSTDCDDGESGVNPGAAEICDDADTDEDCDGDADDDDSSATGQSDWYADADSDGYGDADASSAACDQPSGAVADSGDCDDSTAAVNPDKVEICDSANTDEDCNGEADDLDAGVSVDSQTTWYVDADADGYGDDSLAETLCDPPADTVDLGGDCDDSDAAYHPDAAEDCDDPTDYNCDGSVGYTDGDGDGYAACEECDDGDATISPAGTELCDGADNNCDGTVDEDSAADAGTWYADADGDTYGDPAVSTVSCSAPEGTVVDASDCDDSSAAYHPGATESCEDPADYDCDGSTSYADADGDGYPACVECDDTDATAYPDADEICDGVDNNCDGFTDDASAVDASTWYIDEDGDGYGSADSTTLACDLPDGYAALDTDCDDSDAAFYPGAAETCDDPTDYNCDGSVGYTDGDSDGYAACEECDDGDAASYPDADEICDGADNDCDGSIDVDAIDAVAWYADADGDGYGDPSEETLACEAPTGAVADATDCDDSDSAFHPGAVEDCDAAADYNCDGSLASEDADSDGYVACEECNDADEAINPGAAEICDTVDNDCDGSVDVGATDADIWYADVDADGYGDDAVTLSACDEPDGYVDAGGDCDDANADAAPNASEVCDDGADNDCDSDVDDEDADCDGNTGETGDSGEDTGAKDPDGCGCASGGSGAGLSLLVLAFGLAVARRRQAA